MTFNRTRTTLHPIENGNVVTTLNGASPYNRPTDFVYKFDKRIDDVLTEDYYIKALRGDIINNPVDMKVTWAANPGSGYASQKRLSNQDLYEHTGHVTRFLVGLAGQDNALLHPALPSTEVSDRLTALAKFRAVKNQDRPTYAFAEDIGETRETLRFLRNPLSGLRRLAVMYRRDVNKLTTGLRRKGRGRNRGSVSKKSVKAWANAHAGAWLEYRFAVSPLLRSAYDFAESLLHREPPRPKRLTARGFAKEDFSDQRIVQYGPSWKVHVSQETENYLRVSAGILYEVSDPYEGIAFRYGLRGSDIPVTLWALTPYSFMVDRVVDISGAIQGITQLSNPQVQILAGWVTHHWHSERKNRVTMLVQSGFAWDVAGDTFESGFHQYHREPWVPSFVDAIPEINLTGLVDDATKLLDLTSLILAGFSRRR